MAGKIDSWQNFIQLFVLEDWRQTIFRVESRKHLRTISSFMLVVVLVVMVPTVCSSAAMAPVIPQVTIISAQPVGSGYLEVQATMSGLALVLAVLSLLLMGCSPQAPQMEPKTNYDPMWQVQQRLSNLNDEDQATAWTTGLPDEASSPDHIHYWAVYKELGMTVIYNSPGADEDAYIYAILLSK